MNRKVSAIIQDLIQIALLVLLVDFRKFVLPDRSYPRFRVSELQKQSQLIMKFRVVICARRRPTYSLASADSGSARPVSPRDIRMSPQTACVCHQPLLMVNMGFLRKLIWNVFEHDVLVLLPVLLPRPALAPVL